MLISACAPCYISSVKDMRQGRAVNVYYKGVLFRASNFIVGCYDNPADKRTHLYLFFCESGES